MSLATLLTFAATLGFLAAMPGPLIAALVARVLTRGPREVLPFVLAMCLGDAIWLSCAVWGLATLAQSFSTLFHLIRWAGVGYLLWLAWTMWHSPAPTGADRLPERAAPLRMFLTGLALSLGNPKIMLFYMAILPTIVDLRTVSLDGWAEMTVVAVLMLALVDLGWILLASRARLLLKSPRAARIANRCGAGVMAGSAVAILGN
ncbi:LysE family translocator [Thioclava sp. BHET1]|nr:LysE family translocator [Thioclava sp. BHET1]